MQFARRQPLPVRPWVIGAWAGFPRSAARRSYGKVTSIKGVVLTVKVIFGEGRGQEVDVDVCRAGRHDFSNIIPVYVNEMSDLDWLSVAPDLTEEELKMIEEVVRREEILLWMNEGMWQRPIP